MASTWNNEDVVRFVEGTLGTNKYNDLIRSSQIDGSTLLHMNATLWKDEFAIEPLHKRLKLDARVKELATGSENASQHPTVPLQFTIPEACKEIIIDKEPIFHEILVNKQAEFDVEYTKPEETKHKVPAVTTKSQETYKKGTVPKSQQTNNKASTGNSKSQEQIPVTKAVVRAREINKQSNRVDLTDVYGDNARPTYERAIRKSFLSEHHPELHSTCKINQDHVRSWCCAHRGFITAENDKEKLRNYCREIVYKHYEEILPYVFKQNVTYYWDPEDIVKFMEQWKYEQARYKVRRAAKGGENTSTQQKHEDEEEENSVCIQERTTLSNEDGETPNSTRVDWVETPDAHVFKADIPGVSKEEVKIEVDEGPCLQIRGERRKEEKRECDMWHRVERYYGGFLRKFKLPEFTNVDGIKAEVNNGVLTVTIPKIPKPRPRTIKVE